MFKAACIIATKDRALELDRLLKSIQAQDLPVQKIILVDAGSTQSFNPGAYPDLKIRAVKARRACLPAQRNQGIALLDDDVPFVCFLDDDLILHPGAFRAMAAFWDQAPEKAGGAVFNIMNEKRPTAGVWLKKLFCTGAFERGRVLPSGYNTLMCPAAQTRPVQWLFGGATVWKREVFKEFIFDDWYEGTGLCEDLDFSYRVGKKYGLYVVAQAKVDHLTGTAARRRNVWFGKTQIINRYHFVRKHKELSLGLCLWAGFGQYWENLFLGIFTLSGPYLARAWGNVLGFFNLHEAMA